MHWYSSHMGGIYPMSYEQDYDDLYCEECGDSDFYLGEADSFEEAWDLVKDDCDYKGSGGVSLQYILSTLCRAYDIPLDVPRDYDGDPDISDDEVLDRIEEIIGEPIRAYEFQIPGGEEGYTDFIIADTKEEVARQFEISEDKVKCVRGEG